MSIARSLSRAALLASALALGGAASIQVAQAQFREKILHSFSGRSDGAFPGYGPLIRDRNSNLYGTTVAGGTTGCIYNEGCGTVYMVSRSRQETVLYAFCHAANCSDGAYPHGGLVADASGNFYGTTFGGAIAGCDEYEFKYGCGTVFRLAPDGTETVLHAFQGGSDSGNPEAGVILDQQGNLYGTTGGYNCQPCGTVWKLAPDGTETILYAFAGGSDGRGPSAPPVMDAAGNLYGTTTFGGSSSCYEDPGCGTVFRIAPDGTYTVLHVFMGGKDGSFPGYGALLLDKKGNLYGTTESGGGGKGCAHEQPSGCGVVFKISPHGKETILYALQGGGADGESPEAGLIVDQAGNFYGTTRGGGTTRNSWGTAFELTPNGTETVLISFACGSHGCDPEAGLVADQQGRLYGTSTYFGKGGGGAVFELRNAGAKRSSTEKTK